MLVETEQCMMTGISELFSGRLSFVYEVVFGHVYSVVRMNHCSRASVLVWHLLVEMPACTLSYYVLVLCALVSMHDASFLQRRWRCMC